MTLSEILSDNLTFNTQEIQQLIKWREARQYEKFNNLILAKEQEVSGWDLQPCALETIVGDINDKIESLNAINLGKKFQEGLEGLQAGLRAQKNYPPSNQVLFSGVPFGTFLEKTGTLHSGVKQIGEIIEAARVGKKLAISYLADDPNHSVLLFYKDHRELAGELIAATNINSILNKKNDGGKSYP